MRKINFIFRHHSDLFINSSSFASIAFRKPLEYFELPEEKRGGGMEREKKKKGRGTPLCSGNGRLMVNVTPSSTTSPRVYGPKLGKRREDPEKKRRGGVKIISENSFASYTRPLLSVSGAEAWTLDIKGKKEKGKGEEEKKRTSSVSGSIHAFSCDWKLPKVKIAAVV